MTGLSNLAGKIANSRYRTMEVVEKCIKVTMRGNFTPRFENKYLSITDVAKSRKLYAFEGVAPD